MYEMKTKLTYSILIFMSTFSFSQTGNHISSMTDINPNILSYEKNEKLTAFEAVDKIKWELAAVAAGTIYLGAKSWNWGSSNSFKLNDEGWFGTDTGSAGADKLGHMYSSYLMNEFFTKRLMNKTDDTMQAAMYGALFSGTIMLMVEVFDGYSVDHGFSYEDLILNFTGIGISYLKNTVPGLDEKLDLRIEYDPTEEHRKHPITDYSGYNYSVVLKLGGFEDIKETPLKYFELQLGYHAEGFKKNEQYYFPEKKTELYVGIGIDLTEVLFNPLKKYSKSPLIDYGDTFFRYYQAPVYISTPMHERKVSY